MPAPRVQASERDLSTRIPSFPGVYGGMVIPDAKRGPVEEPVLIDSESKLLRYFTPRERVAVGYNHAYYSALAYLQQSDKLWVVRAASTTETGGSAPLFGGYVFGESGASPSATHPLNTDLEDPDTYSFQTDELILIHGADPGVWNNDLEVELLDNTAVEPDSFLIRVYRDGLVLEEHTVSRIEGKKDGYGRNIYIEDVLEASMYIRAVDNKSIDETVLPEFPVSPSVLALENGDDGATCTDADVIRAMEQLDNNNAYNMTLLMDGGRATNAVHNEIIRICENRNDCFGVLSVPYEDEASTQYVTDIQDYRNNQLNANTSYAGLFTPHVYIYDKFNARRIYTSPDGYVGALVSYTASNFEMWFPPAGFRRGVINVLDLRRRYSFGEMDALYEDGVNPFRFAPGQGIALWGQKTLLSRPSTLDRINARLLLIQIEPAISEALEYFVFEQNTPATRALVASRISAYMDNIQANGGVYDYQVKVDGENNTAEDIDAKRMNVWVFVKPVQAAEYINFTTIITPTGLSFDVASQSV